MSNHLAIATVTATLQRILQSAIQLDLPGARVTTVRPDASGNNTPEVGVNVYLYQASPSSAWRSSDLRTRRPKGDLIKQAQVGLDLYYLMTFYGNEMELEPQRLLGSTVRTIVDYPILTPEIIRETVDNPTFSFLAGSTLAEQLERVTIVPSMISKEELSQMWSAFCQSPYPLSFACQGSAVLIEGNKTSSRPLPVRRIEFYTTPTQAMVSQVVSEAGANQPIVASSSLIIRGKQLQGESSQIIPQIRIGDCKLRPQKVDDKEIRLNLSLSPTEEVHLLRAGVQSLQVLHLIPRRTRLDPERFIGSNVVPFVLCPTIVEVEVEELEDNGDGFYSAEVRVEVDLTVGVGQRVLLLLNERSLSNPAAYIFTAHSRNEDANVVVFPICDVKPGDYLVRVQVDGAESPLYVDTNPDSETFEQYINPLVEIG